jgi:HTH-like domain
MGQRGDEVSVARFVADQRTMHRVPHTVICAILGISISWFYKWVGRELTSTQVRRRELDAAVKAAFEASMRTYGSPRIHADLVEAGWMVSVKTVADSMQRQGLQGRKPKRRKGLRDNAKISVDKQRIEARRGRNIAKVAAARKLLTLVYYRLVLQL